MTKLYYQIDDEVIEATGDKLMELQNQIKANQQLLIDQQNEDNAKVAAAASAVAKLEAIGLTAEEIAALRG
jgi:hypothetical protein